MKKLNNVLAFAALTAMAPAELYKLASDHVKISDGVSSAKDKLTGALKPFAKIVAAMKRRYTEMREKHEIALDVPFEKFFKDNVKGSLPGRAQSLATLFNSLVLTLDAKGNPMLPEKYFDSAAVDWLEKASAIIKTAQKNQGDAWRMCDDVLDTVNALSEPGDAAKLLREIRKRQTGKGDAAGDGETIVKITPAIAAQILCEAFAAAKAANPEQQLALCGLLFDVNDAWANCGLPEETLKELDIQIVDARKNGVADHIQVITDAEPAALAA